MAPHHRSLSRSLAAAPPADRAGQALRGSLARLAAAAPLVLLAAGLSGCKDDPGSAAQMSARPPVEERKNVNVLKPPVPYGKKIACTTLFPDLAKLGEALGKSVTIDDKSKSDSEAASVCQIKLAGTPPSMKQQEATFKKEGRILGVLPGDEICQVTVYCAFAYELAEVKKKCEAEGQTVSAEIGDLTCVKAIEAGAEYRHIVSALDADSRCRIVVNPGPSVTQEAVVKSCAKAAVDLIGPDNLKVIE